jgi:DNA invertase Pin-like site-specific DNA recombinase
MMAGRVMSIAEIARQFNVSRSTLYNIQSASRLRAYPGSIATLVDR